MKKDSKLWLVLLALLLAVSTLAAVRHAHYVIPVGENAFHPAELCGINKDLWLVRRTVTGKELYRTKGGQSPFYVRTVPADAVYSDNDHCFYYLEGEQTLCRLVPGGDFTRHSLTGHYSAVCGGADGSIFLQDAASGTLVLHSNAAPELYTGLRGTLLASRMGVSLLWNNGSLLCYSTFSGGLLWREDLSAYFTQMPSVCMNVASAYLYSAADQAIYVIDNVLTGCHLRPLAEFDPEVLAMASWGRGAIAVYRGDGELNFRVFLPTESYSLQSWRNAPYEEGDEVYLTVADSTLYCATNGASDIYTIPIQ